MRHTYIIRVNISTKYHEDTTITCEVMAQTRYKLQNFDLWPLSVTLTFDIESWVLYATRLHIRVNISTKYHEDATITCKLCRTRYKLQILTYLSVTLTFDIESWVLYSTHLHHQSEHFYQVSWRYNNNLWSYGPDKV